MKSINITDNGVNDAAIRITDGNNVLVMLSRKDKKYDDYISKNNSDAQRAGVYILTGEENGERYVYVGQAETIGERLRYHNKNKVEAWTVLYYFGFINGEFGKTERDYLEAKIINEFADHGIKCDNVTGGNRHESLSVHNNMVADKLYIWFLEIINDILNAGLFAENKSKGKSHKKQKDNDKAYRLEMLNQTNDFTSVRDVVRFVAKQLYDLNKDLVNEIADENEKGTPKFLFTKQEKVGKSGSILTEQLENAEIYFYLNFNPEYAIKTLEKLGKEKFGIKIRIN